MVEGREGKNNNMEIQQENTCENCTNHICRLIVSTLLIFGYGDNKIELLLSPISSLLSYFLKLLRFVIFDLLSVIFTLFSKLRKL